MIIELEINGARLIISGDNLNVNVSGEDPQKQDAEGINAYRPLVAKHQHHPLKAWRKSSRLTQGEFAAIIGIGKWMVNAIETGRRVPSFDLVKKIVAATDGAVQPNDFFKSKADAA